MKKIFKQSFIVIVLLISIFTLVGCNNKDNMANNDDTIFIFKLNTKGMGQVTYYVDDENKTEFNDEYPVQSSSTKVENNTEVTIEAKADRGWKFVRWTKDGKKYSTAAKLGLKITEDTDLVAVFEEK